MADFGDHTQKENWGLWWLICGFALLAILVVSAGCGKKAPPLPPLTDGNLLASPSKVSYTLDRNQVTIAWSHRVDPVRAKIQPIAFRIYMAQKSADDCEGCPFVFIEAGQVAMPDMRFSITIDPEALYYFRVQALGENGIQSEPSKTITVSSASI